MATFTPPTGDGNATFIEGKNDVANRLFAYYGSWAMGKTVWQDQAGVWHESTHPYQGGTYSITHDGDTTTTVGPEEGLATAQVVYDGGHVHEITADEEAALRLAGYGDNINTEPVDLTVWTPDDVSRFDRSIVTQSTTNGFTLTVKSGQGIGAGTGPSVATSNQREWWTHQHTTGWTDSVSSTLFDPDAFGAVLPQHGLVARTSTSGGNVKGIVAWHDVAFASPTIINVGVWDTPADGSGFSFRSTNFTSALGPVVTNVFPYRLDLRVVGTVASVRVYRPDVNQIPDWDDPLYAFTVDLDSFGDTGAIPTPTEGASGLWLAHSGSDPTSSVRYGPTTFRRL